MTTSGKKKRFGPRQLAVPITVAVLALGLPGCPGPMDTDGSVTDGGDVVGDGVGTDVSHDVTGDVQGDAQADVQGDVQGDTQGDVTDSGPMQGCTGAAMPLHIAQFASCGTVCTGPTDAVLNAAGTTAYFTAFLPSGVGAVFTATMGGTPTMVAGGYQYPIALAIAPDDSALYVVDFVNDAAGTTGDHSLVTESGSTLYRVTLPGGTSTAAPITGMSVKYVAGIAVSADGNTVFLASSASDTIPGVFSVSTAGGMPTSVASGAPFIDPSGITVGPNNTFFVNDVRAGAASRGNIVGITGAAATARTGTNYVSRFPAGVALGCDNASMLVSGSPAAPGEPTPKLSWVAADGTTVTPVVSTGVVSPVGIHRALNANVFVVADDGAGTTYQGAIFTVTP